MRRSFQGEARAHISLVVSDLAASVRFYRALLHCEPSKLRLDYAKFEVAEPDSVNPGTVVVFDESGKLRECSTGYDSRVAGVISGAGGYRPGILLDRQPQERSRAALALVGKVYCKVDAAHGAIGVADRLTSSPTPGHAMKVNDTSRALGAVIGKSLEPLAKGTGLVPILVALQ